MSRGSHFGGHRRGQHNNQGMNANYVHHINILRKTAEARLNSLKNNYLYPKFHKYDLKVLSLFTEEIT